MFTVPVTGVWRVSFSLWSYVDTNEYNYVYIYHNQQEIGETEHKTHWGSSMTGWMASTYRVISTGGRELVTRAVRGDTFHLSTRGMGYYNNIITCFEFLSL